MAYRGVTARLPVGAQGFTGTQNPSQAGPGHLTFVEGVELDGGIIRKDGGASLYNMAAPAHGGLLTSDVKVQLHFDDLDGKIFFPDSNGNTQRTWTPVSIAQVDNTSVKFGTGSLLCNSATWITTPDHADFTLGTTNWTFECWWSCNANSGVLARMFGQNDNTPTDASTSIRVQRSTGNFIQAVVGIGAANITITGTTQFTNVLNTGLHHVAVVRDGDTLRLYVDGVQEASSNALGTQTINDSASIWAIGQSGAMAANGWIGSIDEFRFTANICKYMSGTTFTLATAAFADYTTEPTRAIIADFDTKSLLHFDGADASTTAVESSLFPRTWTAAGNAQLDTGVVPRFGSAYALFDGTGDIFSAPDSADWVLGSTPFTIEGWFLCSAAGGTLLNICGQTDAGLTAAGSSFRIYRTAGNLIACDISNGAAFTTITGTSQFTNAVNAFWNHFAFVRSGNTIFLFLNGVLEASGAFAGTVPDSTAVMVVGGRDAAAAAPWNGGIDEWRFTKGVARWTLPFRPPLNPYVVVGSNAQWASLAIGPHTQGTVQSIVAGVHWVHPTIVQNNIIATASGLILTATAGVFDVVAKSGLNTMTLAPPPYFMFGGGEGVGSAPRLFLFSKENLPQVTPSPVTNPLTFANISGPPADWSGAGNFPTFGVVHAFRVFAGGNASDPHRLYYSTSTSHQDFAGAGSGTLAIYPGEGEKIVGAVSFRGALIVWKYPHGLYFVDTTDPTPANWKVNRVTKAIGGVNQQGIVQIENDISFLDKAGNIHLLSAVQEFGDVNTSNLSEVADIGPFLRTKVNLVNAQQTVGLWYASKRQLWYGLNQIGSNQNDLRMQVTFEGLQQQQDGGGFPPRFFLSRRDVLNALWAHPDPITTILKPMHGDSSGFIWYMDQDARNKNNTAYAMQFQTASTDLAFVDPALATKQKNGEFLELAFEPRGDWDLTVDIFWDEIYVQTILYNMGGSGGTIGSFTLDTDALGAEGARSVRQRMEGSGRRFKMAAQNTGLNQDVSLSEFHLSFSVGDERTVEV